MAESPPRSASAMSQPGEETQSAVGRFVQRRKRFASQGLSPLIRDSLPSEPVMLNSIEEHCQLLSISEKPADNGTAESLETSDDDDDDDGSVFLESATEATEDLGKEYAEENGEEATANSSLSSPSTPPANILSKIERYRNFICSPSIFSDVESPTQSASSFKWSPEQIAILNPVEIDETDIRDFESPVDAKTERLLQKAISEFFDNNLVVPSPEVLLARERPPSPFSLDFDSPAVEPGVEKLKRSVACQTLFSFPRGFNFAFFFGPYMFRVAENQLSGFIAHLNSSERKRSSSSGTQCSDYECLSPVGYGDKPKYRNGKRVLTVPPSGNRFAESMIVEGEQLPIVESVDLESVSFEVAQPAPPCSTRLRARGKFKPRRIDFSITYNIENKEEKTDGVVCNEGDAKPAVPLESPLVSIEATQNILRGR